MKKTLLGILALLGGFILSTQAVADCQCRCVESNGNIYDIANNVPNEDVCRSECRHVGLIRRINYKSTKCIPTDVHSDPIAAPADIRAKICKPHPVPEPYYLKQTTIHAEKTVKQYEILLGNYSSFSNNWADIEGLYCTVIANDINYACTLGLKGCTHHGNFIGYLQIDNPKLFRRGDNLILLLDIENESGDHRQLNTFLHFK